MVPTNKFPDLFRYKNKKRKFNKNCASSEGFISPWWVTGMADGEGNFSININTKSDKISASFKVTQKSHSISVLLLLKEYFSCGSVVIDNRKKEAHKFTISNVDDLLLKVIPHFDRYNLVGSKHLDYLDWKKAISLFENKSRSKNKDLIVKLKEGMNRGRSFEKRWARFSSIPVIEASWLQAFIDCEGSFQFLMSDTVNRSRPYLAVSPTLEIAQNSHDVMLLTAIQKYFGVGYLKPKYDISSLEQAKSSRSLSRYIITNSVAIIKFVDKYPMHTRKHLDYLDWKELVNLKNDNAHHSVQGRLKMLKIKKGMNANKSFLIGDVKGFSTAVSNDTVKKQDDISTLSLLAPQPLTMRIVFILGIALYVILVYTFVLGISIWSLSVLYPDHFLSNNSELVIPVVEVKEKVETGDPSASQVEQVVKKDKWTNWTNNFTEYLYRLHVESKRPLFNPLEINKDIQVKDNTLYDGFMDKLRSMATGSVEKTGPTTIDSEATNTRPDSPFTNTYQSLREEITKREKLLTDMKELHNDLARLSRHIKREN